MRVCGLAWKCLLNNNEELSKRKMTEEEESMTISAIPHATMFLMLAAFLCQHNSDKHDSKMYTNVGNRKNRRKQSSQALEEDAEEFESREALKAFPQERMLSVFTSIYGQYGNNKWMTNGDGTTYFFRALIELKRTGYLVEAKCNEKSLHGAGARITCTVPEKTAEYIALQVNFPLSRYLK